MYFQYSVIKICELICIFCRCELELLSLPIEEFLKILIDDLPAFVKHDFLTRAQASYFDKKKNTVKQGELIITLDFAENYTCQVQNAIQSQHWANVQALLCTHTLCIIEKMIWLKI